MTVGLIQTGWSSLSIWNGNLIQTGPWENQGAGDFPFINFVLNGQDWALGSTAHPDVSLMNSYGFPASTAALAGSNWNTVFNLPSAAEYPASTYVVDWIGTGTVTIPGTITSSTGSISGSNVTGTNVTTYVTNSSTVMNLYITATTSPGFSQLRFYRTSDAAALAAGQIFTPEFLSLCSNFGVIRFLDKTDMNENPVVSWEGRKPVTWWNYCAPFYNPSLVNANYITNTGTAGQYTLAQTGFTLTDKAQFMARISTTNITCQSLTLSSNSTVNGTVLNFPSVPSTIVPGMQVGSNRYNTIAPMALVVSTTTTTVTLSQEFIGPSGAPESGDTIYFSPMLSVNGTAATPIGSGTGGSPVSGTLYASATNPGIYACYTYDEALNVFVQQNNEYGGVGSYQGWPIEICVALCNAVGAHPWFSSPYLALDPISDWITGLATYCKNNLGTGLIPRFEGSNECWNGLFVGTGYGANKLNLLNNAYWYDWNDWEGNTVYNIGAAVNAVYGNSADYHVIVGFQTEGGIPSTSGGVSSTNARLSTNYFGTAALTYATHICIAPYWSGTLEGTAADYAYAFAWTNSSGSTAQTYIADYLAASCPAGLSANNTLYGQWATYAAHYSIPIEGYEGGYNEGSYGVVSNSITGATVGSTTVLDISGTNIWNYLFNTISWSGTAPAVAISGITGTLGTLLNGNSYSVLSATATTITINVNSTGDVYTSGGTVTNTGTNTQIGNFQQACLASPALTAYELTNMENWHANGCLFYPLYATTGNQSWSCSTPDIFTYYNTPTDAPKIVAAQQFQALYG